jgi:heptosyltransferase-2/heptosyltransferase-3
MLILKLPSKVCGEKTMGCTCRNTEYLSKKKSLRIILKSIDKVLKALKLFSGNKIKNIQPPPPGEVHKILIIKPDHLGDMLLLTSVLGLIKNRYKDAVIDIVCGSWSKPVLSNNPYIRQIHIINNSSINRSASGRFGKLTEYIKTLFPALGKIRKEHYDICLFMRSRRGNMIYLARLGKVSYSIGHGTAGFGPLLSCQVPWNRGEHETGHFLEILRPLGIEAPPEPDGLSYGLYPSGEEKASVSAYWQENFSKFDKTAVVHPGAGTLLKTLPAAKWKEVIAILEKNGYKVFITGSAAGAEKDLINGIASPSSSICAGIWSIQELALFFKKASLIVTVDSLSSHLAGWSGVKTIVFFCGMGDEKQWRPLGKNINILSLDKPCSPCETGCEDMACMDFDVNILSELII